MTTLSVYNNGSKVKYPAFFRHADIMNNLYGGVSSNMPKINIYESSDSFMIQLATPGLNKSDISLNVEKELLKISHNSGKGENENQESNEYSYSRKEFDYSGFEKSFVLPESADLEKISATMENGILHVRIPKKEESVDKGPKAIKID